MSRYNRTKVFQRNDILAFGVRRNVEYKEYLIHTMKYGERADLLAIEYYDNPELWWIIAEANPGVIWWPLQVVPGAELKIPVLESTENANALS